MTKKKKTRFTLKKGEWTRRTGGFLPTVRVQQKKNLFPSTNFRNDEHPNENFFFVYIFGSQCLFSTPVLILGSHAMPPPKVIIVSIESSQTPANSYVPKSAVRPRLFQQDLYYLAIFHVEAQHPKYYNPLIAIRV
jgi:hypothetical protein